MLSLAAALAMSLCPPPPARRITCIVDADTVWIDGEKIRFVDLNAPEISQPKCPAEKALGLRARDRLVVLLNSGTVTIERDPKEKRDRDVFGRLLRVVKVDGVPVSRTLIAEKLARPWRGKSGGWC